MKKLMIAALAAATVGGAFAELCEEGAAANGCSVYNVKFTFKTLAAKKKNCTAWLAEKAATWAWTRYADANTAAAFNWGVESTRAGAVVLTENLANAIIATGAPKDARVWNGDLYWADNATRTLEGILWQCTASCFEGAEPANGNGAGAIFFALWEKKTGKCFSYPVFKKATQNGFAWVCQDEQPAFGWMGRYGQKATKIGMEWWPTTKRNGWYGFGAPSDFIRAAGFGTFDGKNLRIKSVSGGAVAQLLPYVVGAEDLCGNPDFFKIQIAYVCQTFRAWCCEPCFEAVDWVPAYGTWSLKYNSSLSKGTKPLSKILPDYAQFSENAVQAVAVGAITAGIPATPVNVIFANGVATFNRALTAAELPFEDDIVVCAGQTVVDANEL